MLKIFKGSATKDVELGCVALSLLSNITQIKFIRHSMSVDVMLFCNVSHFLHRTGICHLSHKRQLCKGSYGAWEIPQEPQDFQNAGGAHWTTCVRSVQVQNGGYLQYELNVISITHFNHLCNSVAYVVSLLKEENKDEEAYTVSHTVPYESFQLVFTRNLNCICALSL